LKQTPKSIPAFLPEARSSRGMTTSRVVPGSTVLRITTVKKSLRVLERGADLLADRSDIIEIEIAILLAGGADADKGEIGDGDRGRAVGRAGEPASRTALAIRSPILASMTGVSPRAMKASWSD